MPERSELVIVGGGQAGLSLSTALTEAGREHVVLERGRVGQSWRTRWESFRLVAPAWTIRLYGQHYDGPEPDAFLPRDAFVGLLEQYATARPLPVREGVEVHRVVPLPGGGFRVETTDGDLLGDQVVIATGPFDRPNLPASLTGLAEHLPVVPMQQYRDPASLPEGPALVVGAGQSACQIAEELHLAGRAVTMACGRALWAPRRIGDRDCFGWLIDSDFAAMTADQLPSPLGRFFANPQLSGQSGGHDVHYRALARLGITLAGHLRGLHGGEVRFEDDLPASIGWGDARFADLRTIIRRRATTLGLPVPDLPDPTPWTAGGPVSLPVGDFAAVVVAAGFRPDYTSVLPVPDAFDALGFPLQRNGSSTVVPGLHFLGVHYQRTRMSATLVGVGVDADVLAGRLLGRPAAA